VKLNVNGADVEVDDRFAASPLLWVLRDVLGMHGTKYGCGIGYCSACTVLIDGRNTQSCQTPAGRAVGKAVTTVEGARHDLLSPYVDSRLHAPASPGARGAGPPAVQDRPQPFTKDGNERTSHKPGSETAQRPYAGSSSP
jgi:hypothetical protein